MINKELEPKVFHFIAIGGVGMSGLAKFLLKLGCKVSGSDAKESKYTKMLEKEGAEIFIGHSKDNVPNDAVIVVSSAIKEDNVELKCAKEKGLDFFHRSDLLKILSLGFGKIDTPHFIGFSGTHGKTTTSGLCSYVLEKANKEPSFVVGGIIPELDTNAICSEDGKYFIAELDESDGTIVKYIPDTLVINNLEADHPDFYKNGLDDVLATFDKVLARLKENAKIIINADDFGCKKLIERNKDKKFITFGINEGLYLAKNIKTEQNRLSFDLFKNDDKVISLNLSIFGKHNVYNALAVAVALFENGEDLNLFKEYFESFSGMGRRFQKKADFSGITVFDDYAHHPSEIKATLSAAKTLRSENSRIVTVFQPHRYTRLKNLWNDFLCSFEDTDKLIIVDVFSAGDKFDEKYNSKNFAQEINHKDVVYIDGSICEAAKKVMPLLKKNDIVITMGAGDITELGTYLAEINNGR